MYQYLSEIADSDKIIYVAMIYGAVALLHHVRPATYTLIAIGLGLVFVYGLEQRKRSLQDDFVSNRNQKVNNDPYLHSSRFLSRDAELIDFFASIRDFQSYNPPVYLQLVTAIDDLLRLERDFRRGLQDAGYQLSNARELQHKIQNLFHSFVYSIPPSNHAMKAFQRHMHRLRTIIQDHVDSIYTLTQFKQSQQGIHQHTQFDHPNHPRGFDPDKDSGHQPFHYFAT